MLNSKSRVKRKNRPPEIRCLECGGKTHIESAGTIFQRRIPGKIREVLVCDRYPVCDSYVSVNRKRRQYGLPAGRDVRALRRKAHRLQDRIVHAGLYSKENIYRMMSRWMSTPCSRTHIRYFDKDQCGRVIRQYTRILRSNRKEMEGQ